MNREKQMEIFKISDMMTASPNSTVKPAHKSQGKYWNSLENQFLILPDSKTLIGGSGSDTLQTEDMTNNAAPVTIDDPVSYTHLTLPTICSV